MERRVKRDNESSNYALRIRRIHADDLPGGVSISGDKIDPLIQMSINGEHQATKPVIDGGSTVKWVGDGQ